MLAYFVGPVDTSSAAVLCIAFICVCIIITTIIGKRRSGRELEMQFSIDQQKLRNEDEENRRIVQKQLEIELAKFATDREIAFKRIDSGMIEVQKNA